MDQCLETPKMIRKIHVIRKELENKQRLIDKLFDAVNLSLCEITKFFVKDLTEIANNNYQLQSSMTQDNHNNIADLDFELEKSKVNKEQSNVDLEFQLKEIWKKTPSIIR